MQASTNHYEPIVLLKAENECSRLQSTNVSFSSHRSCLVSHIPPSVLHRSFVCFDFYLSHIDKYSIESYGKFLSQRFFLKLFYYLSKRKKIFRFILCYLRGLECTNRARARTCVCVHACVRACVRVLSSWCGSWELNPSPL